MRFGPSSYPLSRMRDRFRRVMKRLELRKMDRWRGTKGMREGCIGVSGCWEQAFFSAGMVGNIHLLRGQVLKEPDSTNLHDPAVCELLPARVRDEDEPRELVVHGVLLQ